MRAILRRELHAFFTGLIGPLVLAIGLLVTGIYTAVLSFSEGYANFEVVLSNTSYILLFLVPLLTMRLFAAEPRQGTDKLLCSLPLRPTQIVLGKYLASVCVFAIYCAVLCGYPALLSHYGTVDLATAYSTLFGWFLLGCAMLAIGTFCSALTENLVIAAVATLAVCFLSYILPTVSDYLASSGFAAFILFTFAIILLTVLVFFLFRKPLAAVAVCFSLEIPLIVVLLLDASLLDGTVQRFLAFSSLFARLDSFAYGVFDLTAVVYYLGIVFLFLFFTVLRYEKRARFGWYHTGLTILACGCVLAANLLVSALPSTLTNFDTTLSGVFTLSEPGRAFLASLDQDVTVWLLAETGHEDEGLTELFEQCGAYSSRIRFETRDPVLYPYFAASYTSSSPALNSLIVTGAQRSTVVDFSSVYLSDDAGNSYFNGESALLNAVRYVTADSLPVICALSGHGEAEVGEELGEMLKADGFALQTLNLLSASSIPDDTALILILSPSADLTEAESRILADYLDHGGRLLICTDLLVVSTPNLNALMAHAGLESLPGLVVEGDSDFHLTDHPAYLLPQLGTHDITTALQEAGYRILLPVAHAVTTVIDPDENWDYAALLYSSKSAFRKEDVTAVTTLDYEVEDVKGLCDLALAAENARSGARVVWIGSSMLLDSTVNTAVSGANYALFSNAALWLSSRETGLSIPAKSLAMQVILMSQRDAAFWNAVCVYLLPLAILLAGFAVWAGRRYKHKKGGRRS